MFDHLDFGPHLDVAARSAIGVGAHMRPENQDNCVLIDGSGQGACLVGGEPTLTRVPNWPAGHVRLAVLDGMGGHGHGREAAQSLAEALLSLPPCREIVSLSARLEGLHRALQERFGGYEGARPGTTLTLLELPARGCPLLWHVGDSRLYEITGRVRPLTVDHVPATALAMAGLLDADGWRRLVHDAHAPQIAQAFILGNTFRDPTRIDDGLFALTADNLPPWLRAMPDRRALVLRDDATYLLASDGFWSCLDPAEFVARWPRLFAAGNAAACVDALFAELAERPPVGLQPDNVTAIVLRLHARRRDETALPAG